MRDLLHYYRRFFKLIKPYKWLYLLGTIMVILLLFVENYAVFLIGDVVDYISEGGEDVMSSLLKILFVLSLPLIIEPLAFHSKSRTFSYVVRDLTSKVYRTVLNLDYSFHVDRQTGKLISMIINSPEVPKMFLWHLEWFSMEKLARLLIPLFLVTLISWQIGLGIFVVIICSLPFLVWTFQINIRRRNVLKDADYDRNTTIVDGLGNYETVHAFGKESDEQEILDANLERCRLAMNSYQNSFRLIDFVTRIVGLVLFIVGGVIMVNQFQNGDLSNGEMVVILTYLIAMSSMVMTFLFSFREVIKEMPIVEDFYDLLDSRSKVIEKKGAVNLKDPKGIVQFNKVSFQFNDHDKVVDRLSMQIDPKMSIALVGPSGGGKTTITRLLMRYYDVNDGEITIDEVNVNDLKRSFLRNFIGLVPQEPVLFNRSILYNVGYALDVDDDLIDEYKGDVIEACKRAQIHDFIKSLPDGYDTFVGERGLKLSGGQKQRIAIARVIIKDPRIVIFDEATSMLDSESEIAIQKAFKELSKDKTTIIIAHRLSTITHCDKIYVIDKGKIVEDGTHAGLVSHKGLYSKLWDIQSGGFEKGY